MSERLDLSGLAPVGEFVVTSDVLYNRVLAEAIRAQRSEDALRERVRVLERALRDFASCELDCRSRIIENAACDCGYEQALTGGKEGQDG